MVQVQHTAIWPFLVCGIYRVLSSLVVVLPFGPCQLGSAQAGEQQHLDVLTGIETLMLISSPEQATDFIWSEVAFAPIVLSQQRHQAAGFL